MRKIKDFKVIIDIIQQSKDNFLIKIQFLLAFLIHYLTKQFGINFNFFPRLNLTLEDCYFKARKKTIDFWVLWEDYEQDIFKEFDKIEQKGTFIDVGANVGRYSVLIAKKGWEVYSFEPLNSNFKQLKEHVKINNVEEKVRAYQIGLGKNKANKKIFYLPYKYGEASIVLNKKGSVTEEIFVDKLDNLMKKKYKKPIILKIDVEGFEYEVLEGAQKFIKKNHPIIILEMWQKDKDAHFLENLGYKNKGDFWYYKK